ncbi:MAG: hypothetical protein WDW38_010932 [Sanguina aurantia]
MLSFSLVYGKNWAKAMEIVDSKGVTAYVADKSRRTIYKVLGSAATDHYTVFPRHYCSCHSFFYDVAFRSEAVCCKHQLAARVAAALNICTVIQTSDLTIAQMLME